MLAATGSSQPHTSWRNAVRFILLEDLEKDRLQFSRQVLQWELTLSTNQLDYLFAFSGRKTFEVIFTTRKHLESCMENFEKRWTISPAFQKITMMPLTDTDKKLVHIMILLRKGEERGRVDLDGKIWWCTEHDRGCGHWWGKNRYKEIWSTTQKARGSAASPKQHSIGGIERIRVLPRANKATQKVWQPGAFSHHVHLSDL